MTNPRALHTVGASLTAYLKNSFEAEGSTLTGVDTCPMRLFSSRDFNSTKIEHLTLPVLSLYLFRVTVNEHLRNARRTKGTSGRDVPLPLDLHYLMTVWADDAASEQNILGWAMRELYLRPMLDSSVLHPDADWYPGDVIQIIPAELNTEDLMRIWDALEPPYHLSVSYIARVIRIDAEAPIAAQPVVASRFNLMSRSNE